MEQIQARCRKIKKEDLEMIRIWRMRPDITKYLNSDPVLTMEDQIKWYKKICESDKEFYWLLEVDDTAAGVVSLVNMDETAKSIHTGVYIAEKSKRSLRLIIDLQWNLYDYAFDCLGMHKVCEEVFTDNKAVLKILDLCGSKVEGQLRDHVYKNGCYYDITVRGILREEWMEKKKNVTYNEIEFE